MSQSTPPIYYINLARETVRRERMEAAFAQLGVQAERIDAVLWDSLPATEQQPLYSATLNQRQFHLPLISGEKGCYASHIRAWRLLLASTAPCAVVLEDDVQLNPSFTVAIRDIAALPPTWDMVKLLGRRQGQTEKIRRRFRLNDSTDLIEYRKMPSYAAAYVLSRRGAEKLLQHRIPFGRPVDIDLRFWWEADLDILGIHPPAVALDETHQTSGIGKRNVRPDWRVGWKKFTNKARLIALNWYYQTIRRRSSTSLPL